MDRMKSIISSGIFAFSVATVVFIINRSLGNEFAICMEISSLIFFNIFLGFLAYFTVSDYFGARWKLSKLKTGNLEIEETFLDLNTEAIAENADFLDYILFKLKNGESYKKNTTSDRTMHHVSLSIPLEIISPSRKNTINETMDILIYIHGLTDNPERIRQYTYAFGLLGYTVISCDLSNLRKNHFEEILLSTESCSENKEILMRSMVIKHLLSIFDNIYKINGYKQFRVNIIGESIGGLIATRNFIHYNERTWMNKIILISTISDFGKTFPRFTVPFSKKWLIKTNYRLRGMILHPDTLINQELSPLLLLANFRKKWNKANSEGNWSDFCNEKITLIHSESDGIVSTKNFLDNRKVLKLKKTNTILFGRGGHNQIWNENCLIGCIHAFIKNPCKL